MRKFKKILAFSALLLIALAIPVAIPKASAATGLVCIADPTVNPSSCPVSPASFIGTAGSNITIAVNIQGSDTVNGFDIATLVDPSVLQPVAILGNNSIIHSPNFVFVQTVDPLAGVARFGVVALGYAITGPVTGNLFNIVYKLLTSTRGTEIAFLPGCTNTSVPDTCVTITSPTVDSETVQNGSFVGPVTPNFVLTTNLKSQSLPAGSSTFTTIIVASFNGFTGTVILSTSPPPLCPSCPTWSISPTSVGLTADGSGHANVTFQTTTGTPPSTYNVSVNGTSGTLKHSLIISFVVTTPPTPDFSISANPSSQNVLAGSSATSGITLTSINSFSGTVSLSTSPQLACPSCPGWSVSPTSVTLAAGGTGSATLTFTSFSGGPLGTFNVNVTGTSGSLKHSTIVSFTVVSAISPGVVCIADVSSISCPSVPVMFQGIVGGQLQVAVNVQNSPSLNGFDVQVKTDPAILRPITDSISGTVLSNPFVATNTIDSVNGLVRLAAVSMGGFTTAPTTGRFFSITYSVVGATGGSFILFPGGCSGTSNDGICVTVTNPNIPTGVVPEDILNGNVTVSRPDIGLTAKPTSLSIVRGQTGSSAINVTSINGFAGTVTLSATISPSFKRTPGVSIAPTSVTLTSGGSGTATLLVSTNGGTATGSYTVTITASNGTITRTTTVTVTVLARH